MDIPYITFPLGRGDYQYQENITNDIDQNNRTFEVPALPHTTLPLSDAINEYTRRPHFRHALSDKEKRACFDRLVKLMNDPRFLERYQIERNNDQPIDIERAAFCTGDYYYNHYSSLNSLTPTLKGVRSGNIFNFDLPFRTIHASEQSMKYFISRFPGSTYTSAALIRIAQCRLLQKDYMEARATFKYAIRVSMNQSGFDNIDVAETLSWKMLDICRNYPDGINMSLIVSRSGNNNNINTIFRYDMKSRNMQISITYGMPF